MKQPGRSMLLVCLPSILWLHLSGREGPPTVQAAQPAPAVAVETLVAEGLEHPLYVTHAGDGSGRLFGVEQPGRIRIIQQGRLLDAPFLDISDRVRHAGEQGLLGLAFHPAYKTNGRYVINYVRQSDGMTVIAEFRVSSNPNVSQTGERILLTVAQPLSQP